MAQTETRPGFRLPWVAERTESDQPTEELLDDAPVVDAPTLAEEHVTTDIDPTATVTGPRRPTKFMAELSRAMQVAAETSRDETMARFTAEAKAVVEEIHNASTVEAAALRRRADDDVATVREWSKAEIARIREETEARIALRKTALDGEMDAHGLVIEARVERVTATVSEFEGRMTAFFERLLAEEDPTRIATMAETMPDPPDLADVAASIAEPSVAPFAPIPAYVPTTHVEATTAPDSEGATGADASATPADDAPAQQTAVAVDPGATDFAAAEAEALAFTGDLDDEPADEAEIGHHDEPTAATATPHAADTHATTRVVVLGLVSVASIATFKRGLGRVPGVSSIGVASGPNGEFVFTVSHAADLHLAEAITALPGFEARITEQSASDIEVTAHDPDAGN